MRPVGDRVFEAQVDTPGALEVSLTRVRAGDLELPESWLRDAILSQPALVIDCCSEGSITEKERWHAWSKEVSLDVGRIDVLLVSESGKIAIVETKLWKNPENRRKVIAQVLDYAVSLQGMPLDDLPPLPDSVREAIADEVQENLDAGEFLLVVAADELDPRAVRLGEATLGDHLTNRWNLAMVDVAMFLSKDEAADNAKKLVLFPHLRGVIERQDRRIVRVIVMGESPEARIEVERVPEETSSRRQGKNILETTLVHASEMGAPAGEIAGVKDLYRALEEASRLVPADPWVRTPKLRNSSSQAFSVSGRNRWVFFQRSGKRAQDATNQAWANYGARLKGIVGEGSFEQSSGGNFKITFAGVQQHWEAIADAIKEWDDELMR